MLFRSQIVAYNGEIYIDPSEYTITSLNNISSTLTFTNTYTSNDRINFTVLGYAVNGTTHSWALPVFQGFITDGGLTYTLDNSLQGTNPVNLVVTVNGLRAKPYEGAQYTSDGIAVTYDLPYDGSYSQGLVADNDVSVYVNQAVLVLGIDYVVNAWDGSSLRTITLTNPATAGANILISVKIGRAHV